MATTDEPPSVEAEIEELMRTTNLMRIEVAAAVTVWHGEDASDIGGPGGRPLSDAERQRLGLGRSLAELVEHDAEQGGADQAGEV